MRTNGLLVVGHLHTDSIESDTMFCNLINTSNINGISDTELNHLSGIRSNIQNQIDSITNKAEDLVAIWL